jgi:hypothetical protein
MVGIGLDRQSGPENAVLSRSASDDNDRNPPGIQTAFLAAHFFEATRRMIGCGADSLLVATETQAPPPSSGATRQAILLQPILLAPDVDVCIIRTTPTTGVPWTFQ